MNTAVSVTGRKNCTSGTATRARPNPVNPLTTLAKKMIPDMASIVGTVTTLLLIDSHFPELFGKVSDLTVPAGNLFLKGGAALKDLAHPAVTGKYVKRH